MDIQEQLFQKNIVFIRHILSKGRLDLLSKVDVIFQYEPQSNFPKIDLEKSESVSRERIKAQVQQGENYFVLPQMMPFSQETVEKYQSMVIDYPSYKDCSDFSIQNIYINEETSDPHLLKNILSFRKILEDIDEDPNVQYTLAGTFGEFLVVLDPGDGSDLNLLLKAVPHLHLAIVVPSLEYFKNSFYTFDWLQCWNDYCNGDHKRISVFIADEENPESGILGSLASESLIGLDHSFIYSQTNDEKIKKLKAALTGRRIDACINYLGFTMDEFNMLWHSWQSLLTAPRVLRLSPERIHKPFVVVASGPSLDEAIEDIKSIKDTHYIIAAGSSIRTLLRHGIKPDVLVLLERGTYEVENYQSVNKEFPDLNVKLLASVTCAAELHNLFEESAIYFRSGTTATTLFAPGPKNILLNEGPQTVNAALSLASCLTSQSVTLVGVDLGAVNPDLPRSSSAVGLSPRNLCIEQTGNFREVIYTENELLDGKLVAEDCIAGHKMYGVNFYNCSDGIKINGAQPIKIKDYIKQFCTTLDEINRSNGYDQLDLWWMSMTRFSKEDVSRRWNLSRARFKIKNVFNQLRAIFNMDYSNWILYSSHELTKVLDASASMRNQFVTRAFRGAIQKSSLAIKRQLLVLKDKPEKAMAFYTGAQKLMLSRLDEYELEMYMFCDELESLS